MYTLRKKRHYRPLEFFSDRDFSGALSDPASATLVLHVEPTPDPLAAPRGLSVFRHMFYPRQFGDKREHDF
jgi:hypothetical protein